MIEIHNDGTSCAVTPTKFPDGTSQVWHLPDWVKTATPLKVVWRYEEEREVVDLLSLFKLLPDPRSVSLHIPYLPYARQDKEVGNDATFNLAVLADVLNSLDCGPITSVDVHSPAAEKLIHRFRSLPITGVHSLLVEALEPNFIVFPDSGAKLRYSLKPFDHLPLLICNKTRDQATGAITAQSMSYRRVGDMAVHGVQLDQVAGADDKFLIIDDICDGGATFIGVAAQIHAKLSRAKIYLFVTHGIFSKGREHLYRNGITEVFSTDSYFKDKGTYQV